MAPYRFSMRHGSALALLAITACLTWLMVDTYQRHPAGGTWLMLRWILLGAWTLGMPLAWTLRRRVRMRHAGTGDGLLEDLDSRLMELLALGYGAALAAIGLVRAYL